MTEPTPDRAVTEMSDEELLDKYVDLLKTLVYGKTGDRKYAAQLREQLQADRERHRAALLRRMSLTPTERPADGVMVDRDTAVWAERAAGEMRRAVYEIESKAIWLRVQQRLRAALSATSDGETTDG